MVKDVVNPPLVSVLMTAYNRQQYIGEAIESVLQSTLSDFELIIVDDGSKDNTVAIAKEYASKDSRIKVYVNEKNLGDYPNRNKAAFYARGKYLKYVDSDDKIYPETLEVMVVAMESNPSAALGLGTRDIDSYESGSSLMQPNEAYHQHLCVNGFLENGPLAAIIRKDAFVALGGFSGKRMIGDIELWMKLAAKYPMLKLPKGLVYWRQHEGQEYRVGSLMYLTEGLRMYSSIFQNEDCPISKKERATFLKSKKKDSLKILLKYLIKTGDLIRFIPMVKTVITA